MRFLAEILIRLYQWTVSPLLGPACSFHPTCSQYALEAIRRFGVLRGGWLAIPTKESSNEEAYVEQHADDLGGCE